MSHGGTTSNLSGRWDGQYDGPSGEPVPFRATLSEDGSWLTGTVEEIAMAGPTRGRPIGATLQGRKTWQNVAWLKLYDGGEPYYDAVAYTGTVNADATEIEGRWTIGSRWSGAFLMIRRGGLTAGRVRRAAVKV